VLIVSHDLPLGPGQGRVEVENLPNLADRITAATGWQVHAVCLRGVGESEGSFSVHGWLDDLSFVVAEICERSGSATAWIAGYGFTGTLGLVLAAEEERVGGVACLGSPMDLGSWCPDVAAWLPELRLSGAIRDPAFPPDVAAWAAELHSLDPMAAARALGGRPLLLVAGSEDDRALPDAARRVGDAAGGSFRLLFGAGHRLQADPRAIALLLGWLERAGSTSNAGSLTAR